MPVPMPCYSAVCLFFCHYLPTHNIPPHYNYNNLHCTTTHSVPITLAGETHSLQLQLMPVWTAVLYPIFTFPSLQTPLVPTLPAAYLLPCPNYEPPTLIQTVPGHPYAPYDPTDHLPAAGTLRRPACPTTPCAQNITLTRTPRIVPGNDSPCKKTSPCNRIALPLRRCQLAFWFNAAQP